MNLAAAIAIAAGAVAVYVGLMAYRFALAPGWGEQRWFASIAFGAAAYAFGNVATSLGLSDPVVVALSNVQVASVLFQVWAWFRYLDAWSGRRPGRLERVAVFLLLALSAVALMPGVAFTDQVEGRTFTWLSATYREAVPTVAGQLFFAIGTGSALVVFTRLLSAWRKGVAHGLLHAASFGALLLLGVNDALVTSHVYPGAYLLDVGFVIPIGAMAYSLTQRFVEDSRSLHALRDRLEALVDARTTELAEAQEALHQSEKLASLGQFAAGVAHEVNNPASVVTSSLSYLEEGFASGAPPADAHDTTIEALSAMQRINGLVRRLVDAGRLASVPSVGGTASVRGVVEQALADARAWSGDRIAFRLASPDDLYAGLRPEVLSQILSSLLYNAAEAIPEGRTGQVTITARPADDGRVQLSVLDDGAGMTPEVLRRAFEPFFSTKGVGKGSGLGLPVARALVESLGGELRLESRPGQGTTATLTVPEAAPPA
jgi:signal transduction histidine kinase